MATTRVKKILQTYKKSPIKKITKKITKRNWNKNEDKLLGLQISIYGTKWLKIAEQMTGRSASQCSQRWKRLKKLKFDGDQQLKKFWTSDEDAKLQSLYNKYGPKWNKISKFIPSKNRKSIRNRFVNVLDPELNHSPITNEEDILICQLYSQYGSQWSLISKRILGRSVKNMIKNRFNNYLKVKYFQKPNLYQIKNSEELREHIFTNVYQKNQLELQNFMDDNLSYNSSLIVNNQGEVESIFYFKRNLE